MITFKIVPFRVDIQMHTMLSMFKAISQVMLSKAVRISAVFAFTSVTISAGSENEVLQSSFLCTKGPATNPCPQSTVSRPHHLHPLSLISILMA